MSHIPVADAAPDARAEGHHQASQAAIRRTALAGMIGTTIEWYDFYIYGLAAALVFGTEFFPDFSPTAAPWPRSAPSRSASSPDRSAE
ncbi:hypothetical protein ACFQ10_09820 [Streptomyces indonesiensis]